MGCLRSKALGGCDGEGIFLVLSRGRAEAVVSEIIKAASLASKQVSLCFVSAMDDLLLSGCHHHCVPIKLYFPKDTWLDFWPRLLQVL